MKTFLDENYLITNDSGKEIFKNIKDLPILDIHNHADVKEIADNENYEDIWFIEAATDHYVWEMMRKRGVEEKFITGDAAPKEKWMKLAGIFPDLVGNPTYEWVHLDLQRRLGITDLINTENAEKIWDKAKEVLKKSNMVPQSILAEMKVEVMCSTDDPIDMLENHQKLAIQWREGKTKVLPTWRPDNSMNIFKPTYLDYIKKLSARVEAPITNINELISALQKTHDYFEKNGTKASDHGVETPFGCNIEKARADEIFKKRLAGSSLDMIETQDYMSFMMHEFGKMNQKSGWVTQIHIGAVRDVRDSLYNSLGPDVGGDISDHDIKIVKPLRDFLNAFDGKLKVVLYSLDPNHTVTLATLSRAFGENVSLGSAWWLNDSPVGMKRQLEYVGSVDILMNHAGMVTDSRKLMSYGSRTEMFRRVLSDVMGAMVEKGQMPIDLAIRTAKHVCYEGPKALFNL